MRSRIAHRPIALMVVLSTDLIACRVNVWLDAGLCIYAMQTDGATVCANRANRTDHVDRIGNDKTYILSTALAMPTIFTGKVHINDFFMKCVAEMPRIIQHARKLRCLISPQKLKNFEHKINCNMEVCEYFLPMIGNTKKKNYQQYNLQDKETDIC